MPRQTIQVDRRVLIVLGGAMAVTLVLLGVDAFASGSTPVGVSGQPDGAPAPSIQPDYPTNARGQTYGSVADSTSFDDEPDLIEVQALGGDIGYVEKSLLDELTGANVSSPDEALAWQEAQERLGWDAVRIPVFNSDGRTRIGEFEVTRSVEISPGTTGTEQ